MSINPRDYDLEELRRMARERGKTTGNDGAGGRPDSGTDDRSNAAGRDRPERPSADRDAGASFRAELYRELLPLEAGRDAAKPYLADPPETYAGEQLVFEWLEFLLQHSGYKGAVETLEYYESIGWLSERAASTLQDYLLGLEEPAARRESSGLDTDDHLLSLVYVAKLAAAQ